MKHLKHPRYLVSKATALPAGAVNRWCVYDAMLGKVARDGDRLAYFPTRKQAVAFRDAQERAAP